MPASLAADHQAAQASLASALAREVLAAWNALLDVGDLAKTIPDLSAVVAALVNQYGSASGSVAAEYYGAARTAAAVKGAYVAVPSQPPAPAQVDAGVKWATKGLWSQEPAVEPAKVLTQGAVTTLALDTGRQTIRSAVKSDRQARGWARQTEPGCCYFCAMLASRGAAYDSRETASFQAHAHCRCQPEPVFGTYKAPAEVEAWQKLWRSSTRGLSNADARRAFRQAFEGREVTAARHAAARTAPKPGERAVAGRPESHVRTELAALEKSHAALASSGSNPTAQAWQAARISKLRADLS